MTTKRDLDKWQNLRDNCKLCSESKLNGKWCSLNNIKCSFYNCTIKQNTPPFISDGTTAPTVVYNQNRGVNYQEGLTLRQQAALKLSLQKPKLSFEEIGNKLNISKVAAFKLVTKAKQKMGLTQSAGRLTKMQNGGLTSVSLHNDSISIILSSNLTSIQGEKVKHSKTGLTWYVLQKKEEVILKIFENKTVIQFRKELIGDNIEELRDRADKRIKDFLIATYSKMEYKQLSRHYALLGTEIAKKYVKEGKKLIIYDKLDGKERLLVDLSEVKQDKLHLEAPHTVKGFNDGDKVKSMLDDIINRPSYLPSQTKDILDTILAVQQRYAEQIELHLKVLTKMDKSLNKIARGYNEKNNIQNNISKQKTRGVCTKGRKRK